MAEVSTIVKVTAYEKSKIATKISDLENDLELVSMATVQQELTALKEWVAENYQEVRNIDGGGA
jgi:hypothetical protein